MPVRINLLAEAQALEELRRRDPVKRAIWIGVGLLVLVLVYSSSLQVKAIIAKGELSRVTAQLNTHTNEYQVVLANQRRLYEANRKLGLLQQMATNRVLHGSLLDALQRATLEDVQLTRIKTDEAYLYNEEIKSKTNSTGHITPGRPASVTEKVVVTLEARDSAPNPGDQVNRFKQVVAQSPYFQDPSGKPAEVRLANLSPPQNTDGKPFVLFTLECRFPDKTR